MVLMSLPKSCIFSCLIEEDKIFQKQKCIVKDISVMDNNKWMRQIQKSKNILKAKLLASIHILKAILPVKNSFKKCNIIIKLKRCWSLL